MKKILNAAGGFVCLCAIIFALEYAVLTGIADQMESRAALARAEVTACR